MLLRNSSVCPFFWRGYDGVSEVLVHRSDKGYNSVLGGVESELPEWARQREHLDRALYLWGVGNHGGGPSRRDLDSIRKLVSDGMDLVHASPDDYFDSLDTSGLPVVERGLNPEENKNPDFFTGTVNTETPEDAAVKKATISAIREAVRNLPEAYRICIDFFFFYGMSYKEISETAGIPLNTIRSHIFRAKKILRRYLDETDTGEYND